MALTQRYLHLLYAGRISGRCRKLCPTDVYIHTHHAPLDRLFCAS